MPIQTRGQVALHEAEQLWCLASSTGYTGNYWEDEPLLIAPDGTIDTPGTLGGMVISVEDAVQRGDIGHAEEIVSELGRLTSIRPTEGFVH